jgi:hypothetical protein
MWRKSNTPICTYVGIFVFFSTPTDAWQIFFGDFDRISRKFEIWSQFFCSTGARSQSYDCELQRFDCRIRSRGIGSRFLSIGQEHSQHSSVPTTLFIQGFDLTTQSNLRSRGRCHLVDHAARACDMRLVYIFVALVFGGVLRTKNVLYVAFFKLGRRPKQKIIKKLLEEMHFWTTRFGLREKNIVSTKQPKWVELSF